MPLITTRSNASARGYGAFLAAAASTAFESIYTVTASGGESSLNFTTIPSTYQHLQIRGFFLTSSGAGGSIRFNSDTGSNYARHNLGADGSSVWASGSATQTMMTYADQSGSTYNSVVLIDLIDYASTSKYKTMRAWNGYEKNASGGSTYMYSGLWQSTSAVTSIQLGAGIFNQTFASGSTFALYGIKGA